MNLLLPSSNLG